MLRAVNIDDQRIAVKGHDIPGDLLSLVAYLDVFRRQLLRITPTLWRYLTVLFHCEFCYNLFWFVSWLVTWPQRCSHESTCDLSNLVAVDWHELMAPISISIYSCKTQLSKHNGTSVKIHQLKFKY